METRTIGSLTDPTPIPLDRQVEVIEEFGEATRDSGEACSLDELAEAFRAYLGVLREQRLI